MSLSEICIMLVLLSILVAVLPSIVSGKKYFYYWKTIFTIHFFAGLIGVIDIVSRTVDGKYTIGQTHQIIFTCIFISCVASYILRSHLLPCNKRSKRVE